jgi:hypothetical protein
MLTVPHNRMGLTGKQRRDVVLSFYGIVHDREIACPVTDGAVGRLCGALRKTLAVSIQFYQVQ